MTTARSDWSCGGEMEVAAIPSTPRRQPIVVPSGARSVATGRTGIYLAACAARRRFRGPALVPSYICPSVIAALKAAGLKVRYYPVGCTLGIPLDSLANAVMRWSPSLVVVVQYFGFPVSPSVFDCLAGRRRRFYVLEDCAHGSWLEHARPAVGSRGDLVLTSFRKYLRVPDGGLLLDRAGASVPELQAGDLDFVKWRLAAKLLRAARLQGALGPSAEPVYLDLFRAAERDLDRRVPVASMSPISAALLSEENLKRSMRRRRANFRQVLAAIAARPWLRRRLEPLFDDLPPGVSPLLFPVRIAGNARNRLRQHLAATRVFCPVLWPLPPEISRRTYADSHRLSSEFLGIPIDQRYDSSAIDELLSRLTFACRRLA